ncbi:hypothetical protein GJA_1366 [Janthinobacterium agaricidamnosum NBRC 102515 = DSM 9628]|uniref:Uncharacterized protein n=1 Tax=Janthinobacterium agaricidamnosum NBRC 102515 = DSM 9628 TaxID=1349767 RepID=W0UZM2_9BURK|nr:hypothetical protein GJA_1366 [Janthinobacterium agaricidamnosum NBRC 102515 = DSM 9628]
MLAKNRPLAGFFYACFTSGGAGKESGRRKKADPKVGSFNAG